MIRRYWAQMRAVIRLEMKKTFLSRRGLWVYLIALAPVLMFAGHDLSMMRTREERRAIAAAHPVPAGALLAVQPGMTREEVTARLGQPNLDARQIRFAGGRVRRELLSYTDGQSRYVFGFADGQLQSITVRPEETLAQDRVIFATVFQFFYLRLAIFFGCVGIFTNLFRGEMLDKSLHFYLLAPMRREVLLAGKYFAGLFAAVIIFTAGTAAQIAALSWHFEPGQVAAYMHASGWHDIAAYLGVT